MSQPPTFDLVAERYRQLFAACQPQPQTAGTTAAQAILKNRARYESVALKFPNQMPWFGIGLIHWMEADGSFSTHLHNGDPLSARTVHVPRNRPAGQPPFVWEYSAWDALRLDGWDKVPAERWADVAGVLYHMESYNGWGYAERGMRSPYLWAHSSLEQLGKFVEDGRFDPKAKSDQTGAGTILKQLVTSGAVAFRAVPA